MRATAGCPPTRRSFTPPRCPWRPRNLTRRPRLWPLWCRTWAGILRAAALTRGTTAVWTPWSGSRRLSSCPSWTRRERPPMWPTGRSIWTTSARPITIRRAVWRPSAPSWSVCRSFSGRRRIWRTSSPLRAPSAKRSWRSSFSPAVSGSTTARSTTPPLPSPSGRSTASPPMRRSP